MSAALMAFDESTSAPFVTVAGIHITRERVSFLISAINRAKYTYNIDSSAEIHCRTLFAGDSRKKGPFKHLKPGDILPFLHRVIDECAIAGVTWCGVRCDAEKYRKQLQISHIDGSRPFDVTEKHISALMAGFLHSVFGDFIGNNYNVIFDNDKTKLDWGLLNRLQASHFIKISEKAIEPTAETLPILQLADIGAYVLGRATSAQREPNNRKMTRFTPLLNATKMRIYSYHKDEEAYVDWRQEFIPQ